MILKKVKKLICKPHELYHNKTFLEYHSSKQYQTYLPDFPSSLKIKCNMATTCRNTLCLVMLLIV